MTRVTYGVASSSYHSIRSQSQCAKADDAPSETSKAILRDFYVDDILTGAPSEQGAKQLQTSLINTVENFVRIVWTVFENVSHIPLLQFRCL